MAQEYLQLAGADYVKGEVVPDPPGLPGDSGSSRQLPEATQDQLKTRALGLNTDAGSQDSAAGDLVETEGVLPNIDIRIGNSELSGTVSEVSEQINNLTTEQQDALRQAIAQPAGETIEGESVSIAIDGATVLSRDAQGQMQVNEIQAQLDLQQPQSLEASDLDSIQSSEIGRLEGGHVQQLEIPDTLQLTATQAAPAAIEPVELPLDYSPAPAVEQFATEQSATEQPAVGSPTAEGGSVESTESNQQIAAGSAEVEQLSQPEADLSGASTPPIFPDTGTPEMKL